MNLDRSEVLERVLHVFELYVERCLRGEVPTLIASRELPDGRFIHVVPIGVFRAQLSITEPPPMEKSIYSESWEYKTQMQALIAAYTWDGDGAPPRWWRKVLPDGSTEENKNG